VHERVNDWSEVAAQLPEEDQAELLNTQSARCMNCGTPYCHNRDTGKWSSGC
jgi:glutamate synthase (NADPH/NADH)